MCEPEKQQGLTVTYSLDLQLVNEALENKKSVFKTDKRKIIYTALLGICAVLNLYSFIKSQTTSALILACLCFALAAFIWFVLPAINKKLQSQQQSTTQVTVCFTDDTVTFCDEDGATVRNYNELELSQSENLYILTDNKGYTFAVPKNAFGENAECAAQYLNKCKRA